MIHAKKCCPNKRAIRKREKINCNRSLETPYFQRYIQPSHICPDISQARDPSIIIQPESSSTAAASTEQLIHPTHDGRYCCGRRARQRKTRKEVSVQLVVLCFCFSFAHEQRLFNIIIGLFYIMCALVCVCPLCI